MVNINSLHYTVLRELVTEYQDHPNKITFTKILKRTDMLVLNSIHKHLRRRPELNDIPIEDLYHVGIIGLGRAIRTTLKDEPGHKITARIVAYIRATIDKEYPNYKKKRWNNLVSFEDNEEIGYIYSWQHVTDDHIYENVENCFFYEKLKKLMDDNIIDKQGFMIVYEKVVNNVTFTELGKQLNKSYMYIRGKYDETLRVLGDNLKEYE